MDKIGKIIDEQYEFYLDLQHYRTYAYLTKRHNAPESFDIFFNKTVNALRYTNIEYMKDPKYSINDPESDSECDSEDESE